MKSLKVYAHEVTVIILLVGTIFFAGFIRVAQAGTTINVPAGDVAALIAAIHQANSEVPPFDGPDIIELGVDATYTLNAVDNFPIEGPNGLPVVISEIIINGHGATIERAPGAPEFRIFDVYWHYDLGRPVGLSLNDLTIQGGRVGSGNIVYGGGILNGYGSVTLANCTVAHNLASWGGGIYQRGDYLYPATLTINDSILSHNAGNYGGGISNDEGAVIIVNSELSQNSAASGGAILNYGGGADAPLHISNSTFTRNTAAYYGGAIQNEDATMTLTNCTLADNTADKGGGGVANTSTLACSAPGVDCVIAYRAGNVTIANSTLSGNSATGVGGGGIYTFGVLTVINSTLSGNTAAGNGGGVYNFNFYGVPGMVTLAHSTLADNSTTFFGGGIFNYGEATVKNSILANNLSSGNCRNVGIFTAVGENLDTDGTCPGFTFSSIDPFYLNLGPLDINPPGSTATHSLQPGSVAVDAVIDCTLLDGLTAVTADQRGVPRPIDGDGDGETYCDLGAYEAFGVDSDGDGIPDNQDSCPDEDATGFDTDNDGCIDSLGGLVTIVETLVDEGVISPASENSLLTKVENAQKSATKENICAAVNQLEAFKNEINAQRGKMISDDAADLVIAYADNVIASLLSQLPAGSSC